VGGTARKFSFICQHYVSKIKHIFIAILLLCNSFQLSERKKYTLAKTGMDISNFALSEKRSNAAVKLKILVVLRAKGIYKYRKFR